MMLGGSWGFKCQFTSVQLIYFLPLNTPNLCLCLSELYQAAGRQQRNLSDWDRPDPRPGTRSRATVNQRWQQKMGGYRCDTHGFVLVQCRIPAASSRKLENN